MKSAEAHDGNSWDRKEVFDMRKVILACLLMGWMITFAGSDCRADVSRSAVLFLRIAAGARAAGMGEAFVAISDDATATHWNPAGLGVYPLTSTWLEYPLPAEFELKSMALLRNDIPELNYKRYDVWAISELDLFRLHRGKWLNYERYSPSTGETLESILAKFSQVQDQIKIARMKELTAEFNHSVGKDSLSALKRKVLERGQQAGEDLSSLWEDVLTSWDELLLSSENLSNLVSRVNDFLSDDALSSKETEEISSLLRQVVTGRLPGLVKIPYRILFDGKLTSMSSDGKMLWIGSASGLHSFDGKRWRRYSTEDGLPSNHVTAILAVSRRYAWVGTDQGVVKFDGTKWTNVPFAGNVKDMAVVDFANAGEREFWAATETGLFKLDGESWQPHEQYSFRIGDELEKVVQRFLGSENENIVAQSVAAVKAYNSLGDSALGAGQVINLPYELALGGKVTALSLDDRANLWVGTDRGLKRYDGDRWFAYGYRLYGAKEGDDVNSVARQFLKSDDQERTSKLSQMIIDYNRLDASGKLEPGDKIYVYYNALGSMILSLTEAGSNKLFVGTQYGTIRWDGESWSRYYHAGLERQSTKKIVHQDGESWFATAEKVVIYAHAKREITFMHANWLPELASDLYYDYLSGVVHMEGWGTVGANLTFLSLGENVRTDEFNNVLGTFDSYEMAFTFSYGSRLSPSLSTGLSAKVIYSHLADQGAGLEKGKGSGSSFALDAGLLYKTPIKKLTLGAALTNLGPNIAYIDLNQSDPLPRNLAVGLAYRIVDTPFNRLTGTLEVNKELVGLDDPFSQELEEAILNMGAEYWYGTYVSLRAGYVYDKVGDVKNPTFGAGLQYGLFRFDFAYIPSSKTSALSNTMRFSMTGRF
jgi:hypothetical protein